jgi:hypothetical protein
MAGSIFTGVCAFAGAAVGAWLALKRFGPKPFVELARGAVERVAGSPLVFRKPKERRKPKFNDDQAALAAERRDP